MLSGSRIVLWLLSDSVSASYYHDNNYHSKSSSQANDNHA